MAGLSDNRILSARYGGGSPAPTTSPQKIGFGNISLWEQFSNGMYKYDDVDKEIIICSGGYYLARYGFAWLASGVNNRCSIRTHLAKNGSRIYSSYGSGYQRDSGNDALSSNGFAIFRCEVGDRISLLYERGSSNSTGSFNNVRTYIDLIKLPSINGGSNLDPRAGTDYLELRNTSQNTALGDSTNGQYSVQWNVVDVNIGSMVTSGTNNEIITLKPNKKYLIVCSVGFQVNSSNNRTSRTVLAKIDGEDVPGAVGYGYIRDASNPYGVPNFSFIRETGSASESLRIYSQAGYNATGITPVATGIRSTSVGGLVIYELPQTTEIFSSCDNTTLQNVDATSTDINIFRDDITVNSVTQHNNTKFMEKSNNTTALVKKDCNLFFMSSVYAHRPTGDGADVRITRELNLVVNSVNNYHGSNINYNRGDTAVDSTWTIGGHYEASKDDQIKININKDSDAGWHSGNNNCQTQTRHKPGFYAFNIDSLFSYTRVGSSDLTGVESVYTQLSSGTASYDSLGRFAGEMGLLGFDNVTFDEHTGNNSNISSDNYFNRVMMSQLSPTAEYKLSRNNEKYNIGSTYWFLLTQFDQDTYIYICTYENDTNIYFNDDYADSINYSLNGVHTPPYEIVFGDRISSDKPINVYLEDGITVPSYLSGYMFSYYSNGDNKTKAAIFALEDETEVVICDNRSTSPPYKSDIINKVDSTTLSKFEHYTFSPTQSSGITTFFIISNKAICCAAFRDGEILSPGFTASIGSALQPMTKNNNLHGFLPSGSINYNTALFYATYRPDHLNNFKNGSESTDDLQIIEADINGGSTIVSTSSNAGAQLWGMSQPLNPDSDAYTPNYLLIDNKNLLISCSPFLINTNEDFSIIPFQTDLTFNQYFRIPKQPGTGVTFFPEKILSLSNQPYTLYVYDSLGFIKATGASSVSVTNTQHYVDISDFQYSLEAGDLIYTDQQSMFLSINSSLNLYRQAFGSNVSDFVTASTPIALNLVFNPCGRPTGGPVTIYSNTGVWATSTLFYLNTSFDPLPAGNKYGPGGTDYIASDGVSFQLPKISC